MLTAAQKRRRSRYVGGRRSPRLGDTAVVALKTSKYVGLSGNIFEVDSYTDYVALDLPKGTKLRIDGVPAGPQRKKPKPTGELHWFPANWLKLITTAKAQPKKKTRSATPAAQLSKEQLGLFS